jgi:hypothetical protein
MSDKPLFLTVEQCQESLVRLLALSRRASNREWAHQSSFAYHSLMVCFLLQEMSSAESILRLAKSFGHEWFPINIGYMIIRSMFEVEITARYISKEPNARSKKYIDFSNVLRKQEVDAIIKHKDTDRSEWRPSLQLQYKHIWEKQVDDINKNFDKVRSEFEEKSKRGRTHSFQNWSGKSIKEMARDVNQELEYEIEYSKLSSFVHADIRLAGRFLKAKGAEPYWSLKNEEIAVGLVFDRSASYFASFLRFIGNEFKLWTDKDIDSCWEFKDKIQPKLEDS